MRHWLALGASLMACGGTPGPDAALMNTPVDMYRGASTILIHRPMSVGTRMQVQGVFRKHMRKTALLNGFVLAQDKEDLQLVYDVGKTFMKLDLDGYPKVVHYDVGFVESSDADLPPLAAVAEGRVARLRTADTISVARSGGQRFDLRRTDGSYEVTALSGKLSDVERRALTHPLGPGYEMWFESALAALVGPKSPQREGGEWDVDLERARKLLELFAELAPPLKVKGRVTFVGTEKLNGVLVQRIQASIVGEGGLKHELTKKVHANINRVELSYTGLFPVDLGLPPLTHEWRVKGKGHMVVEVGDVLGDVHFELAAEHQSTVVEVRR